MKVAFFKIVLITWKKMEMFKLLITLRYYSGAPLPARGDSQTHKTCMYIHWSQY